MIGAESGIKISQVQKAVDQQSGADQQHERNGDFGDHQQTSSSISFAASRGIAAAFFQRVVQI